MEGISSESIEMEGDCDGGQNSWRVLNAKKIRRRIYKQVVD